MGLALGRQWELSHQAFRHSLTSIVVSLGAFHFGLMAPKARSHSVAIAGTERVSQAHKQGVLCTVLLSFHHSIRLKAFSVEISLGVALPYLKNSSFVSYGSEWSFPSKYASSR